MAALHSNLLPPHGIMGIKGRYNARHVPFNPHPLHGGRPPSCVLLPAGSHDSIPSMKQALLNKALFKKPASPLPQLKNFGDRIRPVAPYGMARYAVFNRYNPCPLSWERAVLHPAREGPASLLFARTLFAILCFRSGRKSLRFSITRKIPPVSSEKAEACFILFL